MAKDQVLEDILAFFSQVFKKKGTAKYYYAAYKKSWLKQIELTGSSREEAMSSRTTKKLQEYLSKKYPKDIKVEAAVAEGMTLRFNYVDPGINGNGRPQMQLDPTKLQSFDILDISTGTAYEISLSDAFAEFFKDVLKALLDSRVKKLYICMRNHTYKGSSKSGYSRVKDSQMVGQYINLAKLYKLDIVLVDIFAECNQARPD